MLENQQIYVHIPKKIINWSKSDVNLWFKINDIQLSKQMRLNGREFMELTASRLLSEYGLSMFMSRKVMDWIEYEGEDFDQYVGEMGESNEMIVEDNNSSRQEKLLQQGELLPKQQNNKNKINQPITHPPILVPNKPNSDDNLSHSDSYESFQKSLSSNQNQHETFHQNQCQSQSHLQSSINDDLVKKDRQNVDYKLIKYGQWKGNNSVQGVKVDFKNQKKLVDSSCQQMSKSESYPIKAKKPISIKNNNLKVLVLSDLISNDINQNNQDVQTYKNIPQRDNNHHLDQNSLGFKQISSQNILSNNLLTSSQDSPDMKFVKSQLVISNGSILTAFYQDKYCQIINNVKIGRNSQNNIVLRAEGVSRNHAEVIVQEQLNSTGVIQKKYYLRDVGSKYGTFVETDPQRPKKVVENQQYCIGITTIRIDKLKLYKSKEKFDLSLTLIQSTQQQRIFQNRSLVTIGNRKRQLQTKQQQKSSQPTKRTASTKQKREIELQDNQVKNYHCRFVVISGEVYLEQVQGNILEKVQKNVKYPLNKSQCDVKFGDGNVTFRFQQMFKTVLNDD